MSSDIRFRFWLILLDLCWGDYVLFLPTEKIFHSRVKRFLGARFGKYAKESRFLDWLLHRVPELAGFLTVAALFAVGLFMSRTMDSSNCGIAVNFLSLSVTLATGIMGASFFSFWSPLRWWMFSPLIRQYHQLSRFHFECDKPPGVLYVTDGGVQDCTGVGQLLRRRRTRILLAFAGADPNDELGVVRVMLKLCTEQKLASFFHPHDPRKDQLKYQDEFRDDKEMLYCHIGILYAADPDSCEPEKIGKLVLFKNRLPPSWTEENNPWRFSMKPLVTEEEVSSGKYGSMGADEADDDPLYKLFPEELGGIGCCDCCHRRGWNYGTKFPNLTGLNYLTLSPQLFNCYIRLGRAVSPAGILEVFRTETEPFAANDGFRWQPTINQRGGIKRQSRHSILQRATASSPNETHSF